MPATVSYAAAAENTPTNKWLEFIENPNRWKLTVETPEGPITYPAGTDFVFKSPFGSFASAVVTNPDGSANHDKGIAYEAPATNEVAYGFDDEGRVRIGMIHQPRPHADDPTAGQTEHQGEANAVVVFGQVPMGYLDRLNGGKFETPEEGARREIGEETGATAVIAMERPNCPWHNPNPTFVGSWTDLVFAEVDLKKIEQLKFDHNEPIYKCDYMLVPELLKRIREGVSEGAYYRMGISNSILMIFFACHPEFLDPNYINADKVKTAEPD